MALGPPVRPRLQISSAHLASTVQKCRQTISYVVLGADRLGVACRCAGITEEPLQLPAEDAGPQQRLQDGVPPAGQAAVGQRVAIWCPGDGEFHT
jgi:hypothetical protein